jgi:hypothetical protein
MRRAFEIWDRDNVEEFKSSIEGIAEAICVIENLKFDASEEPYKVENQLEGE